MRVGFEFIRNHIPREVHVSKPTWGNHHAIIENSGLKWKEYTYYDPKTRGFDFNGMIASLKNAPKGSVILLHASAHNPTGVDPTMD